MHMFDFIRPALASVTSDAEIRAKIDLAAAKCQTPAVKRLMRQRNLTQIEGESIYIFTSKMFIYREFTAAFRSLDARRVQPWSNYACVLQSALGKLQAPPPIYPKFPLQPEFFVV